jgi:uncharacterized protein (DUF427 family)
MASPERVCDYPRPPALVASEEHIRVEALGQLLCDSRRSLRVLETFHPPTYYLPPEDLQLNLLLPVSGGSYCEWKGIASYYDLVVDPGLASERRLRRAAWSYHQPRPAYGALAGWFAVYPALMDGCWLDGERITPQPGGFYGGWISSKVLGPFKGDPLHPELI